SSDCALLCIASLETLDQADALLQARDVHYVIGRDTAQIGAALAEIAASRARPALNDRDSDERARLQALADDLARLAEQLAALSQPGTGDDDDDAADDAADAVPSLADPSHAFRAEPQEYARAQSAVGARELRELIAMRRLRGRFFDPVLFADPAWDMILDLSAARLEGKTVSVSSLCIASAVPPTTALRWIRLMTESGLLERRADPADARRVFTALSDSAWAQMKGWLAAAAERGAFGI
ncbi:MarR family transcriptional regulator, partial [Blastomonas sp.]|uniref:MarR family transcriptional regulator n=1 Tax=Blastomonas sp. TaxID=1909299 RepID=UPI0035939374